MTGVISAPLLILALVVSGLGDARGLVYASRIWNEGFAPNELLRSAAWFALGIGSYWAALYWADRVSVVSTQVQVLIWFAVTIVGVAVMTGEMREWDYVDRSAAVVVVLVLAFLIVRREVA